MPGELVTGLGGTVASLDGTVLDEEPFLSDGDISDDCNSWE